MGPWFIRDDSNPFRPGCSIDTLRRLAARARIGPDTIIRGPTTRQFWMFARNTPGVANLFGECHSCHTHVNAEDAGCHACGADFAVSDDRQNLGLGPVHLLPGHASPETIAAASSEATREADDPSAALLLLVAGIGATLLLGFASARGAAATTGSPAQVSGVAIKTNSDAIPGTGGPSSPTEAAALLADDGKEAPSETSTTALASFDLQPGHKDLVESA
jgi:hypothetical protein